MADFMFTNALHALGAGNITWTTDSLRVILCMTNTNAAVTEDATTVSGITLDEFDGTAYAREILTAVTWTQDTGNDWAVLNADNVVFGSLGNGTPGTRQMAGYLIIQHVTDDTDSVPLFWRDSGSFPLSSNGQDLTIQFSVNGIWRLRNL